MTDQNINIAVILGTTRSKNQSQKVARYIHSLLQTKENVSVDYLDLSQAHFPLLEERYEDPADLSKTMGDWLSKISNADGIVIVSPEYKNGYPGSLKNFLDYLPPGVFKYKAIGIASVSAGSFGGTTCLALLRLVSIAMGGVVIPDRFQVSKVQEVFAIEGGEISELVAKVAEKFCTELIKYSKALQSINGLQPTNS